MSSTCGTILVMLLHEIALIAYAQGKKGIAVDCDYVNCTFDSFAELFNNLLEFFITIAIILATFGVVMVGINYVVAAFGGGSASAHAKVRELVKSVLLGLILVLCAYLVVKLVFTTLGYTGGDPFTF